MTPLPPVSMARFGTSIRRDLPAPEFSPLVAEHGTERGCAFGALAGNLANVGYSE